MFNYETIYMGTDLCGSVPVVINLGHLLPNCAYCARLGVSTFDWFLSARNLSLNFFGTDCAQVFNFPSCPNVRNTHGSVGTIRPYALCHYDQSAT
eukprot:COSAG02_NODE_163_length_32424_cov_21.759010_19_plen_95_part_00